MKLFPQNKRIVSIIALIFLLYLSAFFIEFSIKTDTFDWFYDYLKLNISFRDMLNLFLGISASIAAWFILYHLIVPKIVFSKIISKSVKSSAPCGYSYRIKLWNIGRRDVVDLDIYIKLKIKGLTCQKKLWHTVELTKRFDKITYLAAGENRIIPFFPNNTVRFKEKIFPKHIQLRSKLEILTLEDILKLGSRSFVRVYILGNDTFSGSRKIFLSKKYYINNIKQKCFKIDLSDRDNTIYKKKRNKSFIDILFDRSSSR